MVTFKDFTVEIRSDGIELPTFDDLQLDDGHGYGSISNPVTTYILASPGSEFSVFVKLLRITISPTLTQLYSRSDPMGQNLIPCAAKSGASTKIEA